MNQFTIAAVCEKALCSENKPALERGISTGKYIFIILIKIVEIVLILEM